MYRGYSLYVSSRARNARAIQHHTSYVGKRPDAIVIPVCMYHVYACAHVYVNNTACYRRTDSRERERERGEKRERERERENERE